jgi:hypothetical protein
MIGDGTMVNKLVPVKITSLSGVVAIAASCNNSFYIKNDGTVWACGRGTSGALGDGTWVTKTSPVQVSGLTGVKFISVNKGNVAFLKNDGTVWTCGANTYGALGDGTTTNNNTPAQVMTGVKEVVAGWDYTMFLKTNNSLWMTGLNANNQLGDGTTSNKVTSISVTIPCTPLKVAATEPRLMLSVSPNPSSGVVTLKVSNLVQNCQIRLYDLAGICVHRSDLNSAVSTLDLSGLPKGIYYYQLVDNTGIPANGKLSLE